MARLFAVAVILSAVWCGVVAWKIHVASGIVLNAGELIFGEVLRDVAWFLVLARLLIQLHRSSHAPKWISVVTFSVLTFAVLLLVGLSIPGEWMASNSANLAELVRTSILSLLVLIAILSLVFIEQLFRALPSNERWKIKFLSFGLGGLFAFDFYMYSEALLFQAVDLNVWIARGYVNVLMVPLIGVSFARNPDWSTEIFVSRKVAFQTVTLLGAGAYLIAMSIAGYYIRLIDGDWGLVGQIVFLFSAIVLLFAVMFSGEARARFKVFLTKHFSKSEYDYREEWLRITDVLSGAPLEPTLRERSVLALADIVESTGGALFRRAGETYRLASISNLTFSPALEIETSDPVVRFLTERRWVINLHEFNRHPQNYGELQIPKWVSQEGRAWLIVPLLQHEELYGFAVLAEGRAPIVTNWEVRDMLLMAGRQIAGHLALLDANEALIEARQFEAFNRLSAYVVHDLKNLIAQLSLIVTNAARHRTNPAFLDDAFSTVSHAVEKMSKLLGQLRMGRVASGDSRRVNLLELIRDAVQHRSTGRPEPKFEFGESEYFVFANPERLTAVIEHLVQNAQEATPSEGSVTLYLALEGEAAVIRVRDTGCGMEPAFIRDQLFRPFRTTKGNAGMGIGVYESREFLRGIGGRLEVTSEVGKGTEFALFVPLHKTNSVTSDNSTTTGISEDGQTRSKNAFGY